MPYKKLLSVLCLVILSASQLVAARVKGVKISRGGSRYRALKKAGSDSTAGSGSTTSTGSSKAPKKRNCKLDTKKRNQVKFNCDTHSDDTTTKVRDRIAYTVQSNSGVQVSVAYSHDVTSTSNDTVAAQSVSATTTQYDLHFDRVIEYRKTINTKNDTTANGTASDVSSAGGEAYNWDTDAVVQEVSLASMQSFSDIQDGNTTATFSIASQNGTAKFQFTISRADISQTVTANKIKIDFVMQNFPWVASDSYVALMCTVNSQQSVNIGTANAAPAVNAFSVDNNSTGAVGAPLPAQVPEAVTIPFGTALQNTGVIPFGEYTWAKEAYVNNNSTTVQVVATSPPDGSDRIAFSFVGTGAQGAADLYWDPEAGVGYSSGSMTLSMVIAATLSVMFTVLV